MQENNIPAQSQLTIPVIVRAEPQAPGVSGFSVTALVTGIVGLVLCWVPGLDLVLAAVAIVFGTLGLHQARTKGRGGFGLAVTGLVTGILTAIAFVIFIVAAMSSGS